MPVSDHFDGSRFHNQATGSGYSLWQEVTIGWELRTKKKNWPARFETPPYQAPAEPLLHGIRVLWIGHSTTLIQTPHLNAITDPILFDSIGPSVFGINTVTHPGVRIESLPPIDVILISHNHYDHLDLRSLHALVDRQRTAPPRILVGRGVGPLLNNAGLSSYAELDWDESVPKPIAPKTRCASIFLRIVGAMFMRVNSKCAHRVRPPLSQSPAFKHARLPRFQE